jgi:hypothetical protein
MVANFLHSEKTLPPDELMERDGPNCAACGKKMSISKVETRVSDAGIRSDANIRMYLLRDKRDRNP